MLLVSTTVAFLWVVLIHWDGVWGWDRDSLSLLIDDGLQLFQDSVDQMSTGGKHEKMGRNVRYLLPSVQRKEFQSQLTAQEEAEGREQHRSFCCLESGRGTRFSCE